MLAKIITPCLFRLFTLGEKKQSILLPLRYCYTSETKKSYLRNARGNTDYEPQSSYSNLAPLQCRTCTHQVQLLEKDHAEWLSLCLLCLNHLAGTTVFFSLIDLNLSHLANKQQASINAEIHPCMLTGNCKHIKAKINLVSQVCFLQLQIY